jgi:hypothetical protein
MMARTARQTAAPLETNNPLEERMTRAQVARRRFKSGLPRKPGNAELSWMQALARTAELFDGLRTEMSKVGVNPDHAQAALVYFQPHARDGVLAHVVPLPKPDKMAEFCERVMSLDKPVFLGVLFLQHDEKAEKDGDTKQANVLFGIAFTTAHDAEARMLAARESQILRGGLQYFVS